jgi:sporulation-control protein
MSLLGIGAAKIDLILEKETYVPGETVHGKFVIIGGTIEQQLKRIECDLVMTDVIMEKEEIINTSTILTSDCIPSEGSNQISFTFRLPDNAQLSTDTVHYRFKTRLIFKKGVESIDQDAIQIVARNN